MGTLGLCTPAADLPGDQAQSEEESLLELTQVLHLASFGNEKWKSQGQWTDDEGCVFSCIDAEALVLGAIAATVPLLI